MTAPVRPDVIACDDCLRRTDLIAGLMGRIDIAWRRTDAPRRLLALPDAALLELDDGGRARRRYAGFAPASARERIAAARLGAVCRCARGYPAGLGDLPDPPAVVHIAGGRIPPPPQAETVAIVGARRASAYGLEVAWSLARRLSVAGVPVVSGMALGVDSAAHLGTLEGPSPTVAVLAGGADVPYPASKRRLHGQIRLRGAVLSELPPGARAMRWCFVARNRLIAALATAVVVVEATERSGSLTTAGFAADLGRTVGAVPGPVTSRLSAGTNALVHDGAAVIRGVDDVLDHLAGVGEAARARCRGRATDGLPPELCELLLAIEAGPRTPAELTPAGTDPRRILRGLTDLELRGLVRRCFGGHYVRAA